jgi:hypothetical protein
MYMMYILYIFVQTSALNFSTSNLTDHDREKKKWQNPSSTDPFGLTWYFVTKGLLGVCLLLFLHCYGPFKTS